MYTVGITTSRCSLCYALLYTNTTSSSIGYSSSNRRHGNRCSITSIERLISSSKKVQKLWLKNHNRTINNRSICVRCSETIRQIEQLKDHIEQLSNERQILMDKIEHNLYKRALILQGQKQRTNNFTPLLFNHQVFYLFFRCFSYYVIISFSFLYSKSQLMMMMILKKVKKNLELYLQQTVMGIHHL